MFFMHFPIVKLNLVHVVGMGGETWGEEFYYFSQTQGKLFIHFITSYVETTWT